MIPDRIMRKIERCLALSQSANAHEAGIALRQAQRLMAANGLSEQDVAVASVTEHTVAAQAGKTPPRYLDALATLINAAFGTQAVYSVSLDEHSHQIRWLGQWRFLGTDGASQVAAYAYEVLQRQLIRDRKAFQQGLNKRIKRATRIRRGDAYAEAWVMGARESIIPLERSEETVAVLEAYTARRFGGDLKALAPRQRGKLRHHDFTAIREGFAAGRHVQLHSGVEQERREELTHG